MDADDFALLMISCKVLNHMAKLTDHILYEPVMDIWKIGLQKMLLKTNPQTSINGGKSC